jgi:hypothetical protein
MSRIKQKKVGLVNSLEFTNQNNSLANFSFDGTTFTFDKALTGTTDTAPLKLGTKDFKTTSGDQIGFQTKPNSYSAGTQTMYGAQFSPRLANAVTAAALVGLSVEPIMKGATSAAVSGDYRGVEVKLSGDSTAAGHTIGGITGGIFLYNTLKTGTYTGGVYPIVVTAHGDTQAWSGLMSIPTGVCQAAAAGATPNYIKVTIGGVAYTITALRA